MLSWIRFSHLTNKLRSLFPKNSVFETVKSKVIISLYETVRSAVSVSLRNLYKFNDTVSVLSSAIEMNKVNILHN